MKNEEKQEQQERREKIDKRELVQKYIDSGWEVVERNPVVLQRGRHRKKFNKFDFLLDE